MAVLIPLTVLGPTTDLDFSSPCQVFAFNTGDIQSVKDYSNTAYPGAKSVVNVKYVVANHFKAHTLYVNEIRTAITTAANA